MPLPLIRRYCHDVSPLYVICVIAAMPCCAAIYAEIDAMNSTPLIYAADADADA